MSTMREWRKVLRDCNPEPVELDISLPDEPITLAPVRLVLLSRPRALTWWLFALWFVLEWFAVTRG